MYNAFFFGQKHMRLESSTKDRGRRGARINQGAPINQTQRYCMFIPCGIMINWMGESQLGSYKTVVK